MAQQRSRKKMSEQLLAHKFIRFFAAWRAWCRRIIFCSVKSEVELVYQAKIGLWVDEEFADQGRHETVANQILSPNHLDDGVISLRT